MRVALNSKADKPVALISGSNWKTGDGHNEESTEYNEVSTEYNELKVSTNKVWTEYNEKSTEYNEGSTEYNGISTEYTRGGGVLYISLGGDVRQGPSYPDPV